MDRISETDKLAREIQEHSEKYKEYMRTLYRKRKAAKKLPVEKRLAWKKALQRAITLLEEESHKEPEVQPFLEPVIQSLQKKEAQVPGV